MKQNVFAGKTELLSTDDFESIDPNFQVSLKKLSKKDAVTKQKGLQEIAELCKSNENDSCKALLPYWSKIYCTLSLDVDNKVRENLQIAHKALASNVGRNLAPYLKQISPIWFISQFDTYPPAASAASASLNATFPESKIKEALIFCGEEIFSFIYDNLINQTVQSLSKADFNKEDSEAKYERIVICCLNGYSHYVEILSNGLSVEVNDKFVASNHKLLSSNKYWQFASHKTSLIRASWYSSLISLCKNCIQFVKDEMKHVVKTVFSNLDEPDPLVLPLIWECVLFSLKIINECKEQVSMEKVIFPKLCSVLEKGGLGNAATIYPNLLPLLSNITDTTTSDKYKFYSKFFHCLHSGLQQPTVKLSHSESEVIINTFLECFRYIIMLYNEEKDFCLQLIKEQLLVTKIEIESDSSYRSNIVPLYIGIADLIFYWERNKEAYPSYNEYLSALWEAIYPSFLNCFTSCILEPSMFSYMFYCQFKFLETFLRPCCRNKKNLKVKFDMNEITEAPIIEESLIEPNIDKNTKQRLEHLSGELLKTYYSYTQDQVSDEFKNACINQMSLVVKLLGFEFFLTSCTLESSEFCTKLHSWLKDDNVPLEPILVLTFIAIASVTEENLKRSLLEDLIQVRPEMLICEAVKLSLTGRKEYSEISSWLKNENVRNVLVSYVDSIQSGSVKKYFSVLKFCLASSRKREYVIGNDTVAELFEKFGSVIEQIESSELDLITSLLEDAFKEDTEEFFMNHSQSVFTLLKSIIWRCFTLSGCSLTRILSKGISCLLKTLSVESCEFKNFLNDCCSLIIKSFEKRENQNGMAGFLNVVNVVFALVNVVATKGYRDNKKELCLSISNDLLITIMNILKSKWQKLLEEISLVALAVHGIIPFEDYVQNNFKYIKGIWDPLQEVVITSYCQSVLFSLKFIFILLGENIGEKSNENIDEPLMFNQDLNQFDSLILDYTYALTLMRIISKYYSSTEQYFSSLEFIEPLAPCLKELVQRIDGSSHSHLFTLLKERDCMNKILWAQTDEIIRMEFLEMEPIELDNSNERILTQDLEESSLRTLRHKLKLKKKGLESFINYISWKFDTYNKTSATALYNTSLNNVGLLEMCLSSEIARFLTELIKYDDSIIEKKTWDFIMNSLAAWALSIEKTQNPKYCKEFVGFIVSFCNLFVTFSAYISPDSSPENSQLLAIEERNKIIRQNWNLFSSDVHSCIFNCWKKYAGQCSDFQMEPLSLLLIESLSNAICHIAQGGKLMFSQNYELISLTKTCSELIVCPCPSVQISSFLTLQSISSHLAKLDSGLDENSTDKISCLNLKETLLKTQTVVEAMLQDFKPGVMCLVTPYTDSYIYTRAYLLTWLVILDIFKAADSRVRHLYTCWMKEEIILNNLMNSLLHLLPNLVVYASETNAKKIQETFSTSPSFSYSGWTSGRLSALSGFVYIHVLRVLPLLSRIWYSESEPKKRDFIDKFTAPYVSPLLINEEINFALNETKKCDNLSLETLPSARLINAVFTVEDSKAELGIQLAHNHPFTPPKVDISKSVVSTSQTKNKLKQLTLFPTLQNGSLWDCIIVWKNYLDKKFEGVEECYICYSVLHYGTHQLPKLSCRTCKKRFHSACLYKWFTSSNKSTCPICRNLF